MTVHVKKSRTTPHPHLAIHLNPEFSATLTLPSGVTNAAEGPYLMRAEEIVKRLRSEGKEYHGVIHVDQATLFESGPGPKEHIRFSWPAKDVMMVEYNPNFRKGKRSVSHSAK